MCGKRPRGSRPGSGLLSSVSKSSLAGGAAFPFRVGSHIRAESCAVQRRPLVGSSEASRKPHCLLHRDHMVLPRGSPHTTRSKNGGVWCQSTDTGGTYCRTDTSLNRVARAVFAESEAVAFSARAAAAASRRSRLAATAWDRASASAALSSLATTAAADI